MKLSKRLEAIYTCIPANAVIADIGSDHAYIPCSYILNNKGTKAYACELRDGPLDNAKQTILTNNLVDSVIPIKSDGLENLPQDVDTIIIAGMGYDTIKHILEAYPNKLTNLKNIIVQSNKNVDLIRTWISDHHYTITNEEIVNDSFFYEIVSFNLDYHNKLTKEECYFGLNLNEHPDFKLMWNERLNILKEILDGLDPGHPKYGEILEEIKLIEIELII
ncbi:MAG: class I SAM-dependent methyltransferase [Erysipelotrichaceae bacterium]